MVDENEPEPRNGIDPQPSGTIHLWDEGRKFRVRQPRFREYRKLGDAWRDIADRLDAVAEENVVWLEKMNKLGDEREERGEPRVTAEDKAEDGRRGKESAAATQLAVLGWWRLLFDTLVPGGWPYDDDDVPIFFVQIGAVTIVLNHWRSVPSLSGVR